MRNKIRYCDLCGERLDPNDTFCKNCGNVKIKDKDAPDAIIEDPKGNSNTNTNVSFNGNLIYIILAILAIIIVLLLVF